MSSSARASADAIAAELAALGTPERAVAERAYLKSELTHLGTAVPTIRRVVRVHLRREHPDHDALVELCDALWTLPVHERRMAAVEALVASVALLDVDDLPWIELLIRDSRTWALVDPLAGNVVAGLAAGDGAVLAVLDRWVVADDHWVRRSAVLGLRKVLAAGREWDRFVRYADLLLDEREFFVRKAIGWVAREEARRRPEQVAAWARSVLPRMSHVTIREVWRPLPDGPGLLAAWQATRARPSGGGAQLTRR